MVQQDQTSENWDQNQSEQSEVEASKQTDEDNGAITFKPRTVTCDSDKHTFYHTGSMSVKCRGCPLGYNLAPGTYLKDGHIYVKDQLLV